MRIFLYLFLSLPLIVYADSKPAQYQLVFYFYTSADGHGPLGTYIARQPSEVYPSYQSCSDGAQKRMSEYSSGVLSDGSALLEWAQCEKIK